MAQAIERLLATPNTIPNLPVSDIVLVFSERLRSVSNPAAYQGSHHCTRRRETGSNDIFANQLHPRLAPFGFNNQKRTATTVNPDL